MVGGGNSAVTEALHLHHIGAAVTIIHRRDSFRVPGGPGEEHFPKPDTGALGFGNQRDPRGEDRVREAGGLLTARRRRPPQWQRTGCSLPSAMPLAVESGLGKSERNSLRRDYIKRDARRRTKYSRDLLGGGCGRRLQADCDRGQGAEAALGMFEDLMNPYWKERRGFLT